MVAIPASAGSTPARARWHSRLQRALDAGRSAAVAALTPHRASLLRLLDMPLAVIGTGCIDFAAWHVDHGVGWLVTGVSLWVVEHLIADDGEAP
jgi:hypothetical protein